MIERVLTILNDALFNFLQAIPSASIISQPSDNCIIFLDCYRLTSLISSEFSQSRVWRVRSLLALHCADDSGDVRLTFVLLELWLSCTFNGDFF
jgi:hypothetical protein